MSTSVLYVPIHVSQYFSDDGRLSCSRATFRLSVLGGMSFNCVTK